MRVTAAVAREAGAPLALEEIELDEPRDDEILVRMEAVGVCHTDMNARDQRLPCPLPMVFGHEGAGTVAAVGSAVTRVVPGDKVLLTPDFCGHCTRCRMGQTTYCDNVMAVAFGGQRPDGSPRAHRGTEAIRANFFGQSSFADHALATERNVLPVAADADLSVLAALTCGVQTGAGAVLNAMPMQPGGSFAVFGAGAVGLAALMAAVQSGASHVVAVDRVSSRLDLALELGATHILDVTSGTDVVGEIHKVTGGCDVVLDTTGVPDVIRQAVLSLGTQGTCGIVAGSGQELSLPTMALVSRGRSLRGIMGGDAVASVFLPRLIQLHDQGRFPFDRLVRHYPFADVNRAMSDSLDGSTIKPVLRFG